MPVGFDDYRICHIPKRVRLSLREASRCSALRLLFPESSYRISFNSCDVTRYNATTSSRQSDIANNVTHRSFVALSPVGIPVMAETTETSSRAASLLDTAHIPIAQLTPLLRAPSTRSIKAIVTLIWPFSSRTNSFTVLLAEPDFRLRQTRGQVRVEFAASSAREAGKAKIGSGDEVILSLDGAEWINDDSAARTPGRGVEWQLRFTERILLQVMLTTDIEVRQAVLIFVLDPVER